jgi:hypothetical protein
MKISKKEMEKYTLLNPDLFWMYEKTYTVWDEESKSHIQRPYFIEETETQIQAWRQEGCFNENGNWYSDGSRAELVAWCEKGENSHESK